MNKEKIKLYKKKPFLMVLSVILLLMPFSVCFAYLTDNMSKQTTFTVGDIAIDIYESDDLDLKMVPGKVLKKDPKVVVTNGGINSYVFIQIEENNDINKFIEYDIADGWTPLPGFSKVFYTYNSNNDDSEEIYILKNNEVYVSEDITKETLTSLSKDSYPLLNFSAYAIQKEGVNDPVDAWHILQNSYK